MSSESASSELQSLHSQPSSEPPPGFIRLVLFPQPQEHDSFYLQIPTALVATVCLKPRKYLKYLGWCVLGVNGTVKDGEGNRIGSSGPLVDRAIYHYTIPDGQDAFAHAIDVEVIKERSRIPSQTTGSRDGFRRNLRERDGRCVWTGYSGVGMHIIPYARGDEWLQMIIDNRPHTENENLDSLTINDIRNGIYGNNFLHEAYFDRRRVVVLKTPNPILKTSDVPTRHSRDLVGGVSYPPNRSRFTLQWIALDEEHTLNLLPRNCDAAFLNHQLSKPADLLLHYNYGAAAVKYWGKNCGVLENRLNIPRPHVPALASMEPSRSIHSGRSAIGKRAAYFSEEGEASGSKRKRAEEPADLEVQEGWDEDDVMLFFWGNSKAARERHAQKTQERTEYLEDWRADATGNPDIV